MTQFISNKELVQQMTEAFLEGNVEAVKNYWAEEIAWHFPRCNPFAIAFHFGNSTGCIDNKLSSHKAEITLRF